MNDFPFKRLPVALTFALIALMQSIAVGQPARSQDAKRAELRSRFGEQLAQLANKCDELQLSEQAEITRKWAVQQGLDRRYLYIERNADPHVPANNASDLIQLWHRKFRQLREDYAASLFGLAGEAAINGDGPVAHQMLYEVLYHDPMHREARRVLELGSPTSNRIARRPGTRTHPEFGWPRGRYWQIESEHYRITTDASADAGVELAKRLEDFHVVWQQVFFRYWSADESLAERFRGGTARLGARKKLNVVLFADREAYIKQLERYEPQIAMSLGYYMKGERTAFFYAGDETVEPTWYHEATHQLFQELGDSVPDVGELANFWIVEGIAVYMESLVMRNGYATLGGVDAERLQYARVRALTGEFYLPLSDLVRLGREDLQRHQDIRHIYTQAAGLAHFLMDGNDHQYRQPTVDFITMLYLGRSGPNTLAARCGVGLDTLDKEYRIFLEVRDEDLAHLSPPELVKNLAFCHTEVTDAGLEHLTNFTSLQWIDLSFTKTTDTGVEHIGNATALRRLNLEATAITDAALETVSRFSQLEELDLSSTRVTDAGIAKLAGLKSLKVLWLTNAQIGNRCLESLRSLSQLEFLEISRTNVTADALAELTTVLPKLNRE
ncbi:MAG: DUF1570 domain-containing protein [Planctomycetaceae bacterium]|nr:DUF1570 domain-containing protein [Planctomycetales bacterium]MCB9923224.1 DUF1570 domain-containing protein [Planctomycetaceae bacterium]